MSTKGWRHTPETLERLADALRGKPHPHKGSACLPEHRAKISYALKGKSNSLKGRPKSPEHRAIMATATKKAVRGVCPLCRRTGILHQDHCHKTGVLREVICSRCNMAIGLLADSPNLCRAIADYLERFSIQLQEPMVHGA